MLELFLYFLLILVPTLALAALVIQAPAHTGMKVLALVIAAVLLAASYLAGTALLGQPKPARLALLESASDEAVVVASLNVEGKAIYLWLILPDTNIPRAYSLPWSLETAEALRQAQVQAENNGTEVRMRTPFRQSEGGTMQQFYAPPQAPMPPKT